MIKPKNNILKSGFWIAPEDRMNYICLDLNENMFITEEKIRKIVSKLDLSKINQYPEYSKANSMIAKYAGIGSNNLLMTNGADQAIELVLRTFCKKKEVVIPLPTFSYYQQVCSVENIHIKKVYYNNKFLFPLKETLKCIDKNTDGIILCSPSNPLSVIIPEEDIIQIIRKAKKYGCFVLIDEVYYEFNKSKLHKKIWGYDNLILIRSFSKGYGIAGLRLGYIISHKENILQLKKVRGPWDVNGFAVAFVMEMLRDRNWLNYIKECNSIRGDIIRLLKQKDWSVLDSNTNFLTFKVPKSNKFIQYMKNNNILVSNLSRYIDSNSILTDYIRMGIPNSKDKNRVITALENYY